ncbi:hypothetical protein E2A64_07660 [Pseudohoeflea suaedae]|uniref:Uncharacterized protein n=1 Tax=Pseudohoeflea suaedae TaxID=877384 RepID=A0A4R5PPH3_9HYPH|nr:hypothetical protein [Pseudohoeflea suaedae]TDH38956.1 hypothetical protein E2A64_07660 [Pseudohoeflea suaedae]
MNNQQPQLADPAGRQASPPQKDIPHPPESGKGTGLSRRRKLGVAIIALVFLMIATVFAMSLAGLVFTDSYVSDPNEADPELLLPWRITTTLVELGARTNVIFAGFIAIIVTGTAWVTEVFRKPWQFWLIVLSCLLGLTSAFYLMVELGPREIAQLKFYGDLFDGTGGDRERLQQTTDAFSAFEIGLILLFSSFLTSSLGIRAAPDDGKLRELLKKYLGEGGAQ